MNTSLVRNAHNMYLYPFANLEEGIAIIIVLLLSLLFIIIIIGIIVVLWRRANRMMDGVATLKLL